MYYVCVHYTHIHTNIINVYIYMCVYIYKHIYIGLINSVLSCIINIHERALTYPPWIMGNYYIPSL